MKRNLILAAALALTAMAISASAQKTTDFSGTWNLDVTKSKPAETGIESQTLVVTQTATDLKVDRSTKRTPPPADSTAVAAVAPPAGRGGRGGMMGGGDGSTTYTLDGKAVESDMPGRDGATMKMSTKAKIDGSSLEITRSFSTPMGDRTSTEKWSLSGSTLTIESARPNRDGGTDTTTRVYTKKS